MSFDLRLWGKASREQFHQPLWINAFWYPDDDQAQGYIIEYRDAPGQFYVTEGTTQKERIVAGPFASLEVAMVAYMLVTGRVCI